MPATAPHTGPPEALVSRLLEELGKPFDLATTIGDRTLGEAMKERLCALRPSEPPVWGSPGELARVAKLAAGPLDFYYRPHLFPGMDPALRLGHHLQFELLPRRLPTRSPLRIAAVLESYCHLSGDLLGWRLEDDELFLWIADVSGHGVRAGLAAAVLYFLVDVIEPGLEPAAFAQRINESMLAARRDWDHHVLFATAFWLRFGADGRGVYASCGHPPMLLRRTSGEIESLESTGMPVGLLPARTYEQVVFRLEPGDGLFLFTDGLVEARDSEGVEFGLQHLPEVLRQQAGTSLEAASAVYHAVQEHRPTDLLEDDLTFMVVEPSPATAG